MQPYSVEKITDTLVYVDKNHAYVNPLTAGAAYIRIFIFY